MKKYFIISILIMVVLNIGIGIYMLMRTSTTTDKNYFEKVRIKDLKPKYDINIVDADVYKEKIINDSVKYIDYTLFFNERGIKGKIYIGSDKHLYITDVNENSVYRVSTEKFKTMYVKNYEYDDGIFLYLISEDGKIYMLILENNDITTTNIYEYGFNEKYTHFVNLDLQNDIYLTSIPVFALREDGGIYDINTGLRFDERTISLFNKIYVFYDNTMTNSYGKMIEDKNGNCYKIKYIFEEFQANKIIPDNKIIIVTEDNRFIYFDDNMETVYEFSKKVKDVSFDVYYPYVEGNLKVTFEDDYSVDFKASCNQYFCVNEFAE